MSENIPFEKDDDEESEGVFDLSNMQDAGESKDMQEAEEQARQANLSMQHRASESALDYAEAYLESDLKERARILAANMAFEYVHYKPMKDNLMQIPNPQSEINRHAFFDALFAGGSGAVPYPHWDSFRGKYVDHRGNPFVNYKTIASRELVEAANAGGLINPSSKSILDSYVEWAKDKVIDGLVDVFNAKMPEWDGQERLSQYMVDLFKLRNTRENRKVGKYFWLSLYNRIMHPGALAPISIALIGGQNVGKSYFSVLLCQTLMNDPKATSIKLNLGAHDYNPFLRDITGQSIIANVGEMTGFKKADVEAMKDFAARSSDQLNFKFMDTILKDRQWIIVMDGNSYDGLQRDETGNRRFFPMFVAQLPDKNGQPQWELSGFKADFRNFHDDVWQIMAECRAWMEREKYQGYIDYVNETSNLVSEFNQREMNYGRGTIRDETTETYLLHYLMQMDFEVRVGKGYSVSTKKILDKFKAGKDRAPNTKQLKTLMTSFGFESYMPASGVRGYLLSDPDVTDGRHIIDVKAKIFMERTFGAMEFEEAKEEVLKIINESSNGRGDF